LPGVPLDTVLAEIPSEWNNEAVTKIERHLRTVGGRAEDFAEEIRRKLA
jgi:hypothetical protein